MVFPLPGTQSAKFIFAYHSRLLAGRRVGRFNIGFRRPYYMGAGTITLFVALSALFQSMPGHLFFRIYQFMVVGAAMLTVSILDHLLLVRTFRQSAREISA